MSEICILGAGRVAAALAAQLTKSGHIIHVGVRDQTSAKARWTGHETTFLDPASAIARARIVFNATPGESSAAFLGALQPNLIGKTLVDVSNALRRDPKGMPIGLLYAESSIAEVLQAALPETLVIKALNTMLFSVIANPSTLTSMPNVFLSGNDIAAKATVRELLLQMAWRADVIEDLGPIETARGPESFMLFVPHIIRSHGFAPFALSILR